MQYKRPVRAKHSITDYRHCIETQDRHLEGSKMGLTPLYILLADRYYLQITIPISAIYYPIISYYPYLLYIYIEPLELHLQSSRSFISTHCKVYIQYTAISRTVNSIQGLCFQRLRLLYIVVVQPTITYRSSIQAIRESKKGPPKSLLKLL